MLVKKILLLGIFVIFSFNALANTPRSTGKYKNWESFVACLLYTSDAADE